MKFPFIVFFFTPFFAVAQERLCASRAFEEVEGEKLISLLEARMSGAFSAGCASGQNVRLVFSHYQDTGKIYDTCLDDANRIFAVAITEAKKMDDPLVQEDLANKQCHANLLSMPLKKAIQLHRFLLFNKHDDLQQPPIRDKQNLKDQIVLNRELLTIALLSKQIARINVSKLNRIHWTTFKPVAQVFRAVQDYFSRSEKPRNYLDNCLMNELASSNISFALA